jgi:hypothetical protein
MRRLQCRLLLSGALHTPSYASLRGVSADGAAWISRLRYGFPDAPFFGTTKGQTLRAKQHATLQQGILQQQIAEQQHLYCKALVYASSGSRLARDWIAGCAALEVSDSDLVQIALHHDAGKADIHRFAEHLTRRSAGSSVDPPTELSPASSSNAGGESSSCESMETIQRCFIYDAMKAATFHEPCLAAERLLHIRSIATLFGLSDEFVSQVKEVVDEEQAIMTDKFRVLDQPTADQ